MKIGLSKVPATPSAGYSPRLGEVLSRYAPEHEYIVDEKHLAGIDLYHCHGFRTTLPMLLRAGRKSVVTVPDLNFLRYPHLYTLPERLFLLGAYRRALRRAGRLIALNRPAREELSRKLEIDPRRIEVLMPLATPAPQEAPLDAQLEAVRRKYMLPRRFVLMLGTVEPRHNHEAVFEALASSQAGLGVVVCGRRTVYSDFLLGYARARHMAARVDFIYELSPADLPALFRLARVLAYLPDAEAEASIVPVVEAMRASLPVLLSDTPLNREAAADAALYVYPEQIERIERRLLELAEEGPTRCTMQERERRRAELFSEYAVAQRLIDIYTSL